MIPTGNWILLKAIFTRFEMGLLIDAAHDLSNLAEIRGVFQKNAERFHRIFAIAARLMIFHTKHAWYMLIKYRQNQGFWSSHVLETVA